MSEGLSGKTGAPFGADVVKVGFLEEVMEDGTLETG